MELKIKKLHPDAIIPTYGSDGAACFDLYALVKKAGYEDATLYQDIRAGEQKVIHTGLAFEIPPDQVLMVYSRSGHGRQYGVRLANGTGILDSDYRGELMLVVRNDGSDLFSIKDGDRIAQAMLVPVERITFALVDELSDTARGIGGFGSTGA